MIHFENGDCLSGMLKIKEESVDLVFADPPFNVGYEYDVYKDTLTPSQYLDWSVQWMEGVKRVLKPDGTFWLAIGDDFAAELKLQAQDLGFYCRQWVIWHYSFGVHCTRKFARCHTHLFYFTKSLKDFTFNADAIRVPSARQTKYRDRRANPLGRIPGDVWTYSRVCGTFKERAGFHGCQMPERLLGRIIRACSNPDDLILDPFVGSGTTLAVAKKLGRSGVGFELSEEYHRLASIRVDSAQLGDPLEGNDEVT